MIYQNYSQAQQKLADIEAIDYFFAKEITLSLSLTSRLSNIQEQTLVHILIALSASLRAGHSCLPMREISDQHWAKAFDAQGQCSHQGFIFPNNEILCQLMAMLDISANANKPIFFENKKLYMRRYFQFEQALANDIQTRLQHRSPISTDNIGQVIQQLFPNPESDKTDVIDWQKVAVANAMNKNFSVIAGGPGTGKTYTVTKLLAALIMLNNSKVLDRGEINSTYSLDISLVAPTGKAAQRLSESIISAISGFKGLIDDHVLAAIPTEAQTIHRLLGVIPNSPNFRHNQNNLLTCDILLIDEVSMVDLPMMARIFRALKRETKVILLGDADQLPSVAVGSVLADIAPRPHCGYSRDNFQYLAQVCQLDVQHISEAFEQTNHCSDHLSFLKTSRRFDGEGEIGRLATHVIQGEDSISWQLLQQSSENIKSQLSLTDSELDSWLSPLIKEYYQEISQCVSIDDAFALLSQFRILCVTRQGEFGVDAINQWVKDKLRSYAGKAWGQSQENYHGMPIMISENDYRLGLFNGDIGLLWRANDSTDQLMAFFEQPKTQEGKTCYKTLLPSRLPKYDSVYAMTIHKTQGSEFSHVAMLLPKQVNNLLLSRELLYTGITRAKEQLTIATNKQTWQQGVVSVVKRYSGLSIV